MDYLQSYFWQILASVFGASTLVTGIILIIIAYKKKALSYRVLSSTRLTYFKDIGLSQVKVLYGNNEIEDPYLIIIKIQNTGNLPIKSEDYTTNLFINFPAESFILNAEIEDSAPDGLNPVLAIENNRLSVGPLLLNTRDYYTLKLLLSGDPTAFNFNARIIGVKKVGPLLEDKTWAIISLFLMSLALIFGLLAAIFWNPVLGYTALLILGLYYCITFIFMIFSPSLRKGFWKILRGFLPF